MAKKRSRGKKFSVKKHSVKRHKAPKGKKNRLKKRLSALFASGGRLLRLALKDPLVREYLAKQKKLAKITINKALKRAEKRIRNS